MSRKARPLYFQALRMPALQQSSFDSVMPKILVGSDKHLSLPQNVSE